MFNGKIHYKLPFSIAMLVYHRVPHVLYMYDFLVQMDGSPWWTTQSHLLHCLMFRVAEIKCIILGFFSHLSSSQPVLSLNFCCLFLVIQCYTSPFFCFQPFCLKQHTGRNDRGSSFGIVATWPWSAEAKGHIWKEAAEAAKVMGRWWNAGGGSTKKMHLMGFNGDLWWFTGI